ncbi:peptidylprolyl isomerase, partial [Kordiimonas lipolytica]
KSGRLLLRPQQHNAAASVAYFYTALYTTQIGEFSILLRADVAPLTCRYFLQNVECGILNGTTFFRVLNDGNQPNRNPKIHIIQGGEKFLPTVRCDKLAMETTNITGLRHSQYSVSQPRFAAGTAYPGFFVCLRDEPELDFNGRRHPDKKGFSVFGRVTKGTDVVDAIYQQANEQPYLQNEIQITGVLLRALVDKAV